jgi:UDP-N-acetylmuramyl pentapeptide phosphotransferase/UDP-N-acetylglucosamine-1-phosphate transferase
MRRNDLVSVEANLRSKLSARGARQHGRNQNQVVVRFWIITMILVLFGLSTLKLR